MKKLLGIVAIFPILMLLTSCDDPFSKCRKNLRKDGYTKWQADKVCSEAYGD